jgi:23S rRNA pseudouridine1911/1915/1917 synthase
MDDQNFESGEYDGSRPERARVPENRGGVRLDHFVSEMLSISRGFARKLLESGQVSLDGRGQSLSDKGRGLGVGSEVEVRDYRPREDWRIVPEINEPMSSSGARPAIRGVLARGPGWLAVDKSAGAPVHPLSEHELGTVLNRVAAMHPELHGVGEGALRSGVVHRLDVETSGVLLVATEQSTWKRLRDGFREHRVEKKYLALVAGVFERPIEMEVGLVVAQHRPARVRVVDIGRSGAVWTAVQSVRPIEVLGSATLVEVRPRTGFLHQIRATLAGLGHPVLGDRVYGSGGSDERAGRQQLHAASIRFEEIEAESPLPEDFESLLIEQRDLA